MVRKSLAERFPGYTVKDATGTRQGRRMLVGWLSGLYPARLDTPLENAALAKAVSPETEPEGLLNSEQAS